MDTGDLKEKQEKKFGSLRCLQDREQERRWESGAAGGSPPSVLEAPLGGGHIGALSSPTTRPHSSHGLRLEIAEGAKPLPSPTVGQTPASWGPRGYLHSDGSHAAPGAQLRSRLAPSRRSSVAAGAGVGTFPGGAERGGSRAGGRAGRKAVSKRSN